MDEIKRGESHGEKAVKVTHRNSPDVGSYSLQ